jgi:hypothetical protein
MMGVDTTGLAAASSAAAASSLRKAQTFKEVGMVAESVSEIGQKLWRAVGGEAAINSAETDGNSDPRTIAVLKNLKGLLWSSEIWQIRHSCDKDATDMASPIKSTASTAATAKGGSPARTKPDATTSASPNSLNTYSMSNSPSKAPNFAEAAVEALAAAKRAEASRLVVERLAGERLAAEQLLAKRLQLEDFAADRLTSECAEGERLSAERMAAMAENERVMADRVARCEAREAACEQQVAAEQSRIVLLRAELESSRRDGQSRNTEAKLAEALKAREVHHTAKAQCLESMHEDAQREIEKLRLQHHVSEVDLGRCRSELTACLARQKVLEEELRLLKERPPKGSKSGSAQKRVAGGKLLDRSDLASRVHYEASAPQNDSVHEAKVFTRKVSGSGTELNAAPPPQSSWFFGCCSTAAKASPSPPVNAAAPEKPQA